MSNREDTGGHDWPPQHGRRSGVISLLYHSTCRENAERLLREGWRPGQAAAGGNQGQRRYLYLTNVPENARWFAEENGGDVVLAVKNVPLDYLQVRSRGWRWRDGRGGVEQPAGVAG